MALKLWRFISLYLTGLTLSLTFSHLLEMPRKMKYPQDLYMAVQHSLYLYFGLFGGPIELAAVVSLCALCFIVPRRKPTFALTVAAAICVTAGLAIWFAMVAPANAQMARWTAIPLPNNWMQTRRLWETGHAISAVFDLAGFGALIASVLFDTVGAQTNG
jgi:hypothetical protein